MTSPSSTSSSYYQRSWRFAGMIAIAIAGLMAAGSIWNGILRDTAIHAVRIFSQDVPGDLVAGTPFATCVVYWFVFVMALTAALYLAFLDMRYIRLQYALEKQQLLRQSLGEDVMRKLPEKDRLE